MSKLAALLAMSMLGSAFGHDSGPKKSNKERYEGAKKQAAQENQDFVISLFHEIMGTYGDEEFTALQFVDCMTVYTENGPTMSGSSMKEMMESKALVVEEITRVLDHWSIEKALYSSTDGASGIVSYGLTDYGRGLIKGFKMGTGARGTTKFTLVRDLSDEQLAAMDAKEEGEVCPGCGEVHDENEDPLEAIARMMGSGRKRRSREGGEMEELLQKLRERR